MAQGFVSRVPKKVAVIGGGISGIACMWRLKDEDCECHMFEAASKLGGHANAVPFHGQNGKSVTVDTAFVTFNEESYPRFFAFLRELGVPTIPTDMSFGVSEDDGKFEWGSSSAWSFVNTARNLLNPWFWRLIFDILRFNFFATDLISRARRDVENVKTKLGSAPREEDLESLNLLEKQSLESIGQYLDRERYSEQFKRYYIIPMVAAPWCIDPEDLSRDFPATTLIRFMSQHRLLSTITHTLRWRTFKNGSRTYIDAFLRLLKPNQHVHLNTPVTSVTRQPDGRMSLATASGTDEFEHVVFATHASHALRMLGASATEEEQNLLGKFKTSRNECVLHSDVTMLPKKPLSQVSWNCIMESQGFRAAKSISNKRLAGDLNKLTLLSTNEKEPFSDSSSKTTTITTKKSSTAIEKISITFDMNRLQAIPLPGQPDSPGRVLVSMNPPRPPRFAQSTHVYHNPIFTSDSVGAAARLHLINGVAGASFAGAWMGYGFHEDGFAAGTQVAEALVMGREHVGHTTAYGNVLPEWEMGATGGARAGIDAWVEGLVRAFVNQVQMAIDAVDSYSRTQR